MSWKQFIKDYLTFSKKDRIGVLSLIVLMTVFVYLIPHFFSQSRSAVAIAPDTSLQKAMDTLQVKHETTSQKFTVEKDNSYVYEPSLTRDYTKRELFRFDPNTLSTEGWKRLGLNDRTIKTINNYRSKGGRFHHPEDLRKIWDLPKDFYERVAGYISIAPAPPNTFSGDEHQAQNSFHAYSKPDRRPAVVEVNAADTSALVALPGIGSKLASRITNFRDKLGGFYSIEQIGETYGLPDSTFQKLKPYLNVNAGSVRKININSATKDELKMHPYIKWNLANAIVEYRNQHGIYKSVTDIKNIALVDEAVFNKIVHYLTVKD